MPSVTIDGGVLAAPRQDATRNQVLRYVENLLEWGWILEEPRWVDVYMSARLSEILFADGIYPLRKDLKPLFAATGIVEYDANTVAQVAEAFLRLTPTFEDYFRMEEAECTEVFAEPDLLATHTSAGLAADLSRCVVLMAVLRGHCPHCVVNHALVVRPWASGSGLVQIRALLGFILHERDDLNNVPQAPVPFQGSVHVCQNVREFILAIDEVAVWRAARGPEDLMVALQVALYKSRLQRGLEPEWEEEPSFSLGSQFYATAQQTGTMAVPGRAEKVLRAMVATVDDQNLGATHWLRTGGGANNPQRTVGSAKAWRRDIDYEYHLHYWKCHDDSLELGSVVVHSNFAIPNPELSCQGS